MYPTTLPVLKAVSEKYMEGDPQESPKISFQQIIDEILAPQDAKLQEYWDWFFDKRDAERENEQSVQLVDPQVVADILENGYDVGQCKAQYENPDEEIYESPFDKVGKLKDPPEFDQDALAEKISRAKW